MPAPLASASAPTAAVAPRSSLAAILQAEPAAQAFFLLRAAFTIAPIAFGLDKFFNIMVNWTQYLAPWINDLLPGNAHDAMHLVGVVEIAAGALVAVRPRLGAPLVAAWLGGIIINLLTGPGYYDVALRDTGLLIGALALTRLAWADTPAAARP